MGPDIVIEMSLLSDRKPELSCIGLQLSIRPNIERLHLLEITMLVNNIDVLDLHIFIHLVAQVAR